jgi:hypothetical protein
MALAAHCYLVSKKGLQKLTKAIKKVHYHIDMQMDSLDLNVYALNPKLAYQKTSLFSTSNVELSYPHYINKIFEHIKDPDNRPYSYIFSMPIINIGSFPFSAWTIFLILISGTTSFCSKPIKNVSFYLLLLYTLLEISTVRKNSYVASIHFIIFFLIVFGLNFKSLDGLKLGVKKSP